MFGGLFCRKLKNINTMNDFLKYATAQGMNSMHVEKVMKSSQQSAISGQVSAN